MQEKSRFDITTGWKILFQYLGEYKREITFLSFLGVLSAFANASVPYVVGKFFDSLLNPSLIFTYPVTMPRWAGFISFWVIAQLIANTSDWINDKERRRIGTFLHAEYPARATAHLLRLPLSFHKEYKTGIIWDRFMRAGNALSTIIEQVVINLAPQFLGIIVGITIAFLIHPLLASVIVIGITIYVFLLAVIVPPIVKYQRKGHKAWNEAYGDAYDAFANTQTIKQSTGEEYESEKVRRKFINKAATFWYKVEKIWSGIGFYQRMVIAGTQLTVFILSVHFIQTGELTIGGLIALNGYAGMVFGPFVVLGYNWQIIQNGIIAIERAEKILAMPTERYRFGKKKNLPPLTGSIKFSNVAFSYKHGNPVLKNVNFSVMAGEVVALVGESGAGKSTLIDLISGYYFPNGGNVLVDGHKTTDLDLEFLRKYIAVVPQEVALFNDTIKENIRYGIPNATDEEIRNAAKEAHISELIDSLQQGYGTIVGERGIKLSVGQKQRVAIARAILRNPKILILDEPTSALDPKTERAITESLEKLMRGRTTFIIAHRLSTVRKADRIIVLKDGKIAEEGSHDGLMQIENGVYRHIYELHVGLR